MNKLILSCLNVGLSTVLGLAGMNASAVEVQPSLEMRGVKCSSVPDSLVRLRCYDDLFAEGAAEDAAADAAEDVADRSSTLSLNEVQGPVASNEDLVPASKPSRDHRFGSERVINEETQRETPKKISSTVVKVSQKARGEYVFELANGQVWHQIEADRFRFRKDVEVEIFKSTFASYTLDAKGIGRTKVKRVK